MKSILNTVWQILISVGEARHASWLASQGRVEEAKALYGN
jgi:hypothetical protein